MNRSETPREAPDRETSFLSPNRALLLSTALVREITLVVFFLDQSVGGKPITLFFDNVRLAREATGKIEVRPGGSPVRRSPE